jgi:uncharacterized protein (DUF305 family)
MRAALAVLALIGLLPPLATAKQQPHERHQHHGQPQAPAAAHSAGHGHDVGPAGRTYDLRWIDAMVQHHTGAQRMSAEQIAAMRMMDALQKSSNPTIRRLAVAIIVAQRREIIELRKMLQHDGLTNRSITPTTNCSS